MTFNSKIREEFICVFHLAGKCNYGAKCTNLHTGEPFQWQYKDNEWHNFEEDDNLDIEEAFCKARSEVSIDIR